MKRLQLLILFTFAIPFGVFAQSYQVAGGTFFNDTVALYGEVFIPAFPEGNIGVAIIQGSGPSGTDNLWARSFAGLLAEQGIYALLPDKRGVGKSGGDWKTASFEDLAGDAAASVRFLKEEYGLEKTGVMGLSQGGLIAPVAAGREDGVAFVIDVVGAAVPFEELIIHEVANTSRQEGLSPQQVVEVLELHVLMKAYVKTGNWAPLETRYQELETSAWADYVRSFPREKGSWVWDWVRLNFDFDPLPYWAKVEQPVFVAYGAKDEQDNMPVWRSVYRLQSAFSEMGKKNYEIHVYETGHAMYQADEAVLHEGFAAGLVRWLRGME